VKYASDASPYRFVPQAVVIARNVEDITAVLRYAWSMRRHWAGLEVLDGGRTVRVRPGTTIGRADIALSRYGRLMGPDPAFQRLRRRRRRRQQRLGHDRRRHPQLLPPAVLAHSRPAIRHGRRHRGAGRRGAAAGIRTRAARGPAGAQGGIEADGALVARIRAKYELKNTNGYRLDAFLDGTTPVEILRGLMVGSQGTLGFIAETVFETVSLDRLTHTALLFLPDLAAAAAAVPQFNDAGARAVELMDGNTLRACASVDGVPVDWAELRGETAALLVEFRAPTHRRTRPTVPSVTNRFVDDPATVHTYWHARETFMTAVGKARPAGTTLITEDFAIPPSPLVEACEALAELQRRHGYDAAVAGHAARGNLHFLLAFDAARPEDVQRYADFMDEFCAMVVSRFDGSLTRPATHAAVGPGR
jgi:D-lactate dehydrogenase